jgi:hypothetical protein
MQPWRNPLATHWMRPELAALETIDSGEIVD